MTWQRARASQAGLVTKRALIWRFADSANSVFVFHKSRYWQRLFEVVGEAAAVTGQ